MEYLDEQLNKTIDKIAQEREKKFKRQPSVKEMLDEMDRQRVNDERQSNRWWRKNMNLGD